MKLTIIPDVHGRPFWRDAVKDVADTPVIFLGDYLDPNRLTCKLPCLRRSERKSGLRRLLWPILYKKPI